MDIRILPSNIANMIAAGEVVQRPASVVKELMENALDAGADQVTVVIQDAGRTLIQVIDNGCGMSPDEAVLCFERHATSKIATAEDLMNIHTFGFRGEALASIAAVAEVTLRTRREGDEVGCEVRFADSNHISTEEAAVPRGANFAVRNLFYNVPARRKFLKSDNVEFKHILSEFTRVALTRPDAGFTLVHNGKEVFVLKPAKSLKFRIQDLTGPNVVNELVDISADTSVVKVSGYIGRPDMARKSLGNQYMFVNGRYFKSPYLNRAVLKGYEHLITEGTTPSYFIWLEADPRSLDVNISPTKTEVKFEDDSVIFQILYACIKESLGKNSFVASIDFDREGAPEIPVFGKDFEKFHPVSEPVPSLDPTYNPFDNDGFPSENSPFTNVFPGESGASGEEFRQSLSPAGKYPGAEAVDDILSHGDIWPGNGGGQKETAGYGSGLSGYVDRRDDYGKLFEDKTLPSKAVVVVKNKYLVTSVKSGLLVVNVRRARERIFYERFMKALSKNEHITQTSLFPVPVQVGVENRLLFEEHADLLASLGFDISPFGNDTVVVNGVPEGYSVDAGMVQTMVFDMIVALSDDHNAVAGMMESAMAERFARMGAAGDNSAVTSGEAQRLIDALFACENAEYTSSGHRTMALLSVEDLDRKF